MQKIRPGYILPSAAYTVSSKYIRHDKDLDRQPELGDLVFGRVTILGGHGSLENKEGRIHMINDGTRAVFVYGNRYAGLFRRVNTRTQSIPGRFARPLRCDRLHA